MLHLFFKLKIKKMINFRSRKYGMILHHKQTTKCIPFPSVDMLSWFSLSSRRAFRNESPVHSLRNFSCTFFRLSPKFSNSSFVVDPILMKKQNHISCKEMEKGFFSRRYFNFSFQPMKMYDLITWYTETAGPVSLSAHFTFSSLPFQLALTCIYLWGLRWPKIVIFCSSKTWMA